jgi:hypothetical protein
LPFQIPAGVTSYRVLDANYTPYIALPIAKTTTGRFSIHIDNASGYNTKIAKTTTDLPSDHTIVAGSGFSIHFEWSNGAWRWVYAPEVPGTTTKTVQTAASSGSVTIASWNSTLQISTLTGNLTINYPTPAGNIGKTIDLLMIGTLNGFTITHIPAVGTVTFVGGASELGTPNGALTVEAIDATNIRQISNIGNPGVSSAGARLTWSANFSIGTATGNATPNVSTIWGSGITYDSATGNITLSTPGRYKLRAPIRTVGLTSGQQTIFKFADGTGVPYPAGIVGNVNGVTNAVNDSGSDAALDLIVGATPLIVRLTWTFSANNAQIQADSSCIEIEQISGFLPISATAGDYLTARCNGSVNTNVATGDHIKFNTVVSSSGTSIALDTSTAYASTAGAASIGRFTLQPNKIYELELLPSDIGGGVANTGWGEFSWVNCDINTEIEPSSGAFLSIGNAFAAWSPGRQVSKVTFKPIVATKVEARITSGGGWTSYGGGLNSKSWYAKIKVVG